MAGKSFEIPLKLPSGELRQVAATLAETDPSAPGLRERQTLIVHIPELGERTYVAGDQFQCLLELRRDLEPLGYRVLVQGARRNAWLSGMLADAAGGSRVYLLELGKHEGPPPVALTFDPADENDVATVGEQEAFRDAWLGEVRDRK